MSPGVFDYLTRQIIGIGRFSLARALRRPQPETTRMSINFFLIGGTGLRQSAIAKVAAMLSLA
jgi:hypothetical protein